jgi:hypothetical protein
MLACYKMGFDTMASDVYRPDSAWVYFGTYRRTRQTQAWDIEVKREEDGGFYVTVKTGPRREHMQCQRCR